MIDPSEYERLSELREKSEELNAQIHAECPHTHGVWRYRLHSNGTKHYGRQCLQCGQLILVKKSLITVPLEDIPEIDKEIQVKHKKLQDGLYKHKSNVDNLIYQIEAKINRETNLAEYYSSESWATKRKYRLRLNQKLFNGLCEICFSAPATHVHHFTYDRLHREYIFDLGAICESCHKEQHPHMRETECANGY